MSKKRLEEIKKRKRIGYNYNPTSVEVQQLDIDFNWLVSEVIEQAERVQELENKIDRIRFVNNDFYKQNKRYREIFNQIKKTSNDFREGHLLDIQDSFFVDEIIAILEKVEVEQ